MHIKKIDSGRAASLSDSEEYVRIHNSKKSKTGVLRSKKSSRWAHDRHNCLYRYCLICKKAGMIERKYLLNIADDYTGVRTKRPIKDGIGGPMGSRTNAAQQYKKFENKWKK